ncbi:MAG: hypothetical protein AAF492_21130, partial [Verrucomicrobiota bacterium]
MRIQRVLALVVSGCMGMLFGSGSIAQPPPAEQNIDVVPVSDVEWEKLNPARGRLARSKLLVLAGHPRGPSYLSSPATREVPATSPRLRLARSQ